MPRLLSNTRPICYPLYSFFFICILSKGDAGLGTCSSLDIFPIFKIVMGIDRYGVDLHYKGSGISMDDW